MKYAYLLLLLAAPAYSCEMFATVGKTTPSANTQPIGVAGIGCRFETEHHKFDIQALWVGEAELYDGALRDDGFPLVTVAEVWQFKRKFLRATPEFHAGLGLKEADRCAYNGETNCNRRMPLPFSFHFGVGLEWRRARLQLFHDSNNAMDRGEEKKNLGVTWLTLTGRFN